MNTSGPIAKRELILGGQRSGKWRPTQSLARHWRDESHYIQAVLIAKVHPRDDKLRRRIAGHQSDDAGWVGQSAAGLPLSLKDSESCTW